MEIIFDTVYKILESTNFIVIRRILAFLSCILVYSRATLFYEYKINTFKSVIPVVCERSLGELGGHKKLGTVYGILYLTYFVYAVFVVEYIELVGLLINNQVNLGKSKLIGVILTVILIAGYLILVVIASKIYCGLYKNILKSYRKLNYTLIGVITAIIPFVFENIFDNISIFDTIKSGKSKTV